MRAFLVLENWNKTPMDLGVPEEHVDRCYLEAMLIIKAGVNMALSSHTGKSKRPH